MIPLIYNFIMTIMPIVFLTLIVFWRQMFLIESIEYPAYRKITLKGSPVLKSDALQRYPDQASICDKLGVRMCGRKHCFCCINVQHKCAEIAEHKASHKSHLWQHINTHTWCHTSVQTSHPQVCGAVKTDCVYL